MNHPVKYPATFMVIVSAVRRRIALNCSVHFCRRQARRLILFSCLRFYTVNGHPFHDPCSTFFFFLFWFVSSVVVLLSTEISTIQCWSAAWCSPSQACYDMLIEEMNVSVKLWWAMVLLAMSATLINSWGNSRQWTRCHPYISQYHNGLHKYM
jgi:hypothetical protein